MLKRPSGTNWEFDGFQVMTDMRLLIAGGTPVPLTSKAFDTLVVLIENGDRVVTKDELLRSVWPDVEVEEGNLTQQIFLLRKALGETAQQPRYIVTIPGHGYRFTAHVNAISDESAAAVAPSDGAESAPAVRRSTVTFIGTGVVLSGAIALLTIVFASRWMPMKNAGAPVGFTKTTTRITESGKATSTAISRDGRYVAYVESEGDHYSLWVKLVGTKGKTEVVSRQPLPIAHLSFSPDGAYLYFARRSARGPMFVLSRVPPIGGLETPVLEDVDSPVSFSPDGREFVFQRGASAESQIVVAAAAGGSQRILARRKHPLAFSEFAPDWSPDGKLVAASVVDSSNNSKSIVLLPVDGGSNRELYTTTGRLGRLRWLPDGSGLLAVISEAAQGRMSVRLSGGTIWRIGYPEGRGERLTTDLAEHDLCCVDIQANGSAIVSVVNTLVSDVWIAPADDLDALTQVTSDHRVVGRHSWLPDNDTMVYRDLSGGLNAVRKDGRGFSLPMPDGRKAGHVSACGDHGYVVFRAVPGNNIWRVKPDAGGAVKLTSGLNDFNPACSPDGKWVFYASREPRHVSLWRVSIDGGAPSPLGIVDSYDVLPSPSGRMIYYSTDALEGVDRNRPDRWVVMSLTDQKRLFELDVPGDAGSPPERLPIWAPDETGLDYVVTRKGVSNIWRQPLDGGPRVQITTFSVGQIFSFAWSPDGRWLSLGRGDNRSDVIMMSDRGR